MKSDRYITWISLIASVLTILSFMLSIFLPGEYARYALLGVIALFALVSVFIVGFISRKPSTVSISLLGAPGSGKSVYLTVLFNELIANNTHSKILAFQAYGIETVEETNRNFKKLRNREWIHSTPYNYSFHYKASASLRRQFFNRNFKIEIGDYAGEHLKEFDKTEQQWFHRTSFFKDVITSDVLLFGVDCSTINDRRKLIDTETDLIASIQVILDEKGISPNKKMNTPIAILFLKIDLLFDGNFEEEVMNSFKRLINMCKSRCSKFKIFHISSVGKLGDDKLPPEHIEPYGVVEPMVWCLEASYTTANNGYKK